MFVWLSIVVFFVLCVCWLCVGVVVLIFVSSFCSGGVFSRGLWGCVGFDVIVVWGVLIYIFGLGVVCFCGFCLVCGL